MRSVGIIPARYGSTRLPAKALADIAGQTLIERVYRSTCRAEILERVIVATDDRRIADEVRRFGGEAWMTSPDHASGTDRVAEVARSLGLPRAGVVVNIQGDAPFVPPSMITSVVNALREDELASMCTLAAPITDEREMEDPSIVKVVLDNRGGALYFSRAPIPRLKDEQAAQQYENTRYKHIGPYAYRNQFLARFTRLPVGTLENLEGLEQLRALEHGYRIKMVLTAEECLEVDTPGDLERARALAAKSEVTR